MNKIVLTLILCLISNNLYALCAGRFLNPITDVRWNCMFPITIAGVSMGTSGDPFATKSDLMEGARSPLCTCGDPFPRVGITVGFNEVVRYIETVKDPFCMASMGTGVATTGGLYGGSGANDPMKHGGGVNYFQTHMAVFLPFLAMNILTDFACLQQSTANNPLSVVYMSELEGIADGSSSSTMAALLSPEVVLFANPFAQMYCMGDAILTSIEQTDVVGYWCAGGHSIYPLSNFQTQGVSYVDSASIVASKLIFKMTRLGSMPVCLGSQALCGCYPAPIWNKRNYRLQMALPIPDILCRRLGKPFILWGEAPYKNPAFIPNADNLVFLVWRRRDCCAL